MLCYIVSIKAKAKILSPLNIRLPSQKAMAAGIKSSSKSMLLWRATSWWNQCCYVFCWIISRYIFGELSTLFVQISRFFCSCIILLLMGLRNNVTCLNGHHRPQRTWCPSAPKIWPVQDQKMMSDILPPPQDFVKKVSNRKPESNPNHELTIFISLVVPGGEVFSEPPRELKCRWWRFTVCCSRQVRWAPPLRSLTCARAACCSSFEGLRWDVPCRGYAWGLILGSRYVL